MTAGELHGVPDRVTIEPGQLAGSVRVASDKSVSHRALMLASVAAGPVRITDLSTADDVQATAEAIESLGADVENLAPESDGRRDVLVTPGWHDDDVTVDCRNAGTGLRLLSGLLTGRGGTTTLTGDASLRARPMARIARPLRSMGADVSVTDGKPPVTVRPGKPRGGNLQSPFASAQVKSAVLLAGLWAESPTTIALPVASRDHTETMLRWSGVSCTSDFTRGEVVTVEPGRPRVPETGFVVGADPSAAAFWWVAAFINNTTITTSSVIASPRRNGALNVLRQFGARVSTATLDAAAHEPLHTVVVEGRDAGPTNPVVVEHAGVADAVDELPVLALAAAVSDCGMELTGADELRHKESDRIAATATMLRSLGLSIDERPDGWSIPGGQQVVGGVVDAGHDHRIAMTAAIAASCGSQSTTINGFGWTATSYPRFADHYRALGGALHDASDRNGHAAADAETAIP